MTIDELEVLITANTTELRKEINKANTSISSLQKGASKSGAGVLSAFKTLKTGIVALGIGKVIADSIQSGMDAIESDSLFETSLGASADAVRSWSDEVSNALGLNAVAIRKNTGVIYNMTSSMGVAGDSALTMSKGISLLSEDMASFYNLDSAEAFNKLRAGLTGETEPLKALGILVDENTVKQVAYSKGIAQNGAELTQQQKVLARYVAILEQTGNAQGDLAKTLPSPANQMRLFKNQVTQLGIAFSNFLMPVISAVLPYLTAFTKVVTQALNGLSKFLGLTGSGKASEETKKISSNVGGLAGDYDKANKSAKKLKSTLAGFDEMNVLQDNTSDSSGSAGGGAVGGDMGFNLDEYNANLDGVSSKVDTIAEKIKTAFSGVGEVIGKVWNSEPVSVFVGAVTGYGQLLWNYWSTLGINLGLNIGKTWENISGNLGITLTNMGGLWTDFWSDMSNTIDKWGQPWVDGVSGLFNSVWNDVIDPYLQIITTGWTKMSETLKEVWQKYGGDIFDDIAGFVISVISVVQSLWDNVIDPIITPFLEELKEAWNGSLGECIDDILNFSAKLSSTVIALATTIWTKFIDPVVKWLVETLKPVFTIIGNYIGDTFKTMLDVVTSVVKGVMKYLNGVLDFWTGVFTLDFKKAFNGIKTSLTAILDVVVGLFKGIINPFINTLNALISGLNLIKFDIPDWIPVIGGKKFGLNIPKIPRLARGGIVDSPTYAMIGEAGKEAVMPLERNTGWIDQLADKIGEKIGGVASNINLIVKLGEETIFDRFIEYGKDKAFETNGEVVFV